MKTAARLAMLIALSCAPPAIGQRARVPISETVTDSSSMPSPDIADVGAAPEKYLGTIIQLCGRKTGRQPALETFRNSVDQREPGLLVPTDSLTNALGCLIGKVELIEAPRSIPLQPPAAEIFRPTPKWQFVVDQQLTNENRTCLPPQLLTDAEVVVVRLRESERPTQFSIEGQQDVVGTASVSAEKAGRPLVLVLIGIGPTIWDLRAAPLQRLRAILVYGKAGQGLFSNSKIPVKFITPNAAAIACGKPTGIDWPLDDHDKLDDILLKVIGRKADRIFTKLDGGAVNLEAGFETRIAGPVPLNQHMRSSEPVWLDSVPPRWSGVESLMKSGLIRKANQLDVEAWSRAAKDKMSQEQWIQIHDDLKDANTYTVLKPITLPQGMYGAFSSQFIIPADVVDPIDPGSHNLLAFVKDGRCSGGPCN